MIELKYEVFHVSGSALTIYKALVSSSINLAEEISHTPFYSAHVMLEPSGKPITYYDRSDTLEGAIKNMYNFRNLNKDKVLFSTVCKTQKSPGF